MFTFKVVKEQHGWAIRMDERMITPFWSRELAVREASSLADAIRRHGECVEVIVEGVAPNELPSKIEGPSSAGLNAPSLRRWQNPQ